MRHPEAQGVIKVGAYLNRSLRVRLPNPMIEDSLRKVYWWLSSPLSLGEIYIWAKRSPPNSEAKTQRAISLPIKRKPSSGQPLSVSTP